MFYLITSLALFLWFAILAAQAGRTFDVISPELTAWQDKARWVKIIPELLIAMTIASIGLWGWYSNFDIGLLWFIGLFIAFTAISYAGKQSATWAYLRWQGHKYDDNGDGVHDERDARQSTLWAFNRWVATRLGFKFGSEGFSWVWAATKGFITTLPVGGLGLVFLPLGREIASHVRWRYDNEFWMEFLGDGLGYTLSCMAFILICTFII